MSLAPRPGRVRRWAVTLAGALLVGVGAGVVLQGAAVDLTEVDAAPGRAGAALTGAVEAAPDAVPAPARPGAPLRVRIPALGVTAPVDPVAAPGGTLVPPSDATRLGWWADGARPGDPEGSALVAGHTVTGGGGALDRLEELGPGDTVAVGTSRGRIDYVVERTRVLGKGELARKAERLFSQDVPGRLVLITCEDWDGTRYLSNVVVTAVPLRHSPE